MVKIRFFAGLKDLAGRPEIDLTLRHPIPLKGLWDHMQSEIPGLTEWVRNKKVLVAVNREMATEETVIRDGDEIGLMPPFSGGGPVRPGHPKRSVKKKAMPRPNGTSVGSRWTRIQTGDFSLDAELRRLKAVSSRIGGVAIFVGTGRDFSKGRTVTRLTYDHYAGLAEKTLADIRRRALKKFPIIEVCMIHRTGEIPIGGNIVLVVTVAEHRAEAFRACRWCIDELKTIVPIWKKETTPQGEIWVEPRP